MQPARFTDDIGETIAEKMRCLGYSPACSANVFKQNYGRGSWVAQHEGCYAPTVEHIQGSHPDHFGIPYKTFTSKKPKGPECGLVAYSWLKHLVDPKGSFAGVLPFLWHTTPKEIMKDKGFVFHNLTAKECNPGLIWTFMLASRVLFEHDSLRERFTKIKALTGDTDLRVFLTMSISPYGEKGWVASSYIGHGQPITSPWSKAKSFLTHDFQHRDGHRPNGSSAYLKLDHTPRPKIVEYSQNPKPLETLVKLAEDIRDGKAT